jgi:integrase
MAPLPEKPYKIALRPFARFCSERGIEPDAVTQETFDLYESELTERSGRLRPREAHLKGIRAWNNAARIHSGWPPLRARFVSRRQDYSLPWDAFPASFRDEVTEMVAASIRPDLFDPNSPKPIKKATAQRRAQYLHALASSLVHTGYDPMRINSIAVLTEPTNVKAALKWIHARIGERKTTHLRNFANAVCVVAQHWVGVPDDVLVELKVIRKKSDPGILGMTDKNRSTLRHFKDPELVDRFLAIPERVWARPRLGPELTISEAVDLQVALAIELLTLAPVRIGNLSAIRLGEHIIDLSTGRQRRVHLHFSSSEVKNEVDLEFELSTSTIALLDRYLTQVQPALERVPTAYLFPGYGDKPKWSHVLSGQIADMVRQEIGVRLSAHQFRHLAGYIYLKAHPGAYEVVRQLLGHKSIATTMRFYAGMEVDDAIEHYDTLIEERRSRLTAPRVRRK